MYKYKKYESGLLICLTPLQAIIAEKIIELNPHVKFDILLITSTNNEKYNYYYNKLRQLCSLGLYYVFNQSRNLKGFRDFITFINKLKVSGLDKQYDNLYLANINSKHIQYIASINKRAKVFTFDDGTANIIKSSGLYASYSSGLSPFKNLAWLALGVRQASHEIRNRSILHYTIYRNIENINTNLKLIELYASKTNKEDSFTHTIKMFLGQPLNEISSLYDEDHLSKILNILDINYYFPHPREQNIPRTDAIIINSHLIAEDYLLMYMNQNPDTKIELYSFSSGVLLNMNNINQLESYYIYDSHCYSISQTLYRTAQLEFGIPNINIETLK